MSPKNPAAFRGMGRGMAAAAGGAATTTSRGAADSKIAAAGMRTGGDPMLAIGVDAESAKLAS
jgi:hypothetical protein